MSTSTENNKLPLPFSSSHDDVENNITEENLDEMDVAEDNIIRKKKKRLTVNKDDIKIPLGRRPAFLHEKELLDWLKHQKEQGNVIDKYMLLSHLDQEYPSFTKGKSRPTLRKWINRFLHKTNCHSLVSKPEKLIRGSYHSHSNEAKLNALHLLDKIGNPSEVAKMLGLRSVSCLGYWSRIRNKLERSSPQQYTTGGRGRKSCFPHEAQLKRWIQENDGEKITSSQVIRFLREEYPVFTASKRPETLQRWVRRFLCRIHSSNTEEDSNQEMGLSLSANPSLTDGIIPPFPDDPIAPESIENKLDVANEMHDSNTEASLIPTSSSNLDTDMNSSTPRKLKQASHSNEFKLRALRMVDETGGDLLSVCLKLGIKSTSNLRYWMRIRDKLENSIKTRSTTGGGGRKPGFPHENELVEWVLSRQSSDSIRTSDVMAHLCSNYPEFANSKKTDTLRRWTRRFFERNQLNFDRTRAVVTV